MAWHQIAASAFVTHLRAKSAVFVAFVMLGVFLAITSTAEAQSFTVLANFSNSNGDSPLYLTLDAAGNIYGTTYYGGPYSGSYGVVFRLSRRGSGWLMQILHNFNGMDGSHPYSGVVFGPDGSLYGTTAAGGALSYGVVYKLQPPSSFCRSASCYWTETVLYNFADEHDGSGPQGQLVFDRAGNLYGTTIYSRHGSGTVWELSRFGSQWNQTLIHEFTGGSDGGEPVGGVILDQAGNLYGVTAFGGSSNEGVMYEFSPGTSGWTQTIFHTFTGGTDGAFPSGLVPDSQGNLYGFTTQGGTSDWGTAYELQPVAGSFNYSILYAFQSQQGGRPGLTNLPTLHDGNIYGGASSGGPGQDGAIFELTPSAGGWQFTSLHDFSGLDGDQPAGVTVFDGAGNLYGLTETGGTDTFGVVWEITP